MNKILIIGGPTGIGKSNLAVRLALRYNGVIIGADSVQIYRGLDIGSGKVNVSEKRGIPHSMIDILQPNEDYSVQKYFSDAKKCIDSALANNRLPIVVGGTGLYINALLNEQNFAQSPPNRSIREKYQTLYAEFGSEHLHAMLTSIDPTSAQKIAPTDARRIIRALEIYEQTGKRKSTIAQSRKTEYDYRFFIPETDRNELYTAINKRVESMFENGWIEEVLQLRPYWDCRSMQAIGYKEIVQALKNNIHPKTVMDRIQQNTRRYAKRQITFFKWIPAEKIYVRDNFLQNMAAVTDKWLQEDTI